VPARFAARCAMTFTLAALVMGFVLVAAPAHAAATGAPSSGRGLLPPYRPEVNEPALSADDRAFDAMVNDWFAEELVARPAFATGVGVHVFDGQLERTDKAAIDARLAHVRAYLARAAKIGTLKLTFNRRIDKSVFVSKLAGNVLEIETVRSWEHNPNYYTSVVSGAVYGLVKRDFAPVDARLKSLNERLALVPRVFDDARANLANPPHIFTEIAIGQAQGLVSFLRDLVPPLVAGATDPAQKALFVERNAAAVKAAQAYADWLKSDLLARSNGEFRLGRATYQTKLRDDEMCDTDVDTLLAQGYAALEDNERRMQVAAHKIDPALTPKAALDDMAKHHPAPDSLILAARSVLDKIRNWIADAHILTPPVNQNLNVVETPVFARSLTFASMDSPGVYETHANEAYFNVTPVDNAWPADKQAEHLGFFNPWQLEVVSIHEAFPGHYYQFMHLKQVPSIVRQLMGSGSNSEGWAHYCEEMAIEQGYGGGDPRYELAMLNLARQRIGRFICGIEMHVHGWTFEQSTAFFVDRCYMAPVNAEREARRGTSDPTYLVYTLGKWEIQKLRKEVENRMGGRFDLARFHDRFLDLGRTPLSAIRTAFLDPKDGILAKEWQAGAAPGAPGAAQGAGSDIAK
jgi:uncharacterized protein (DUF885 family)